MDSTLWKPSVEKPVENVEKCEFSTTKSRFYTGRGWGLKGKYAGEKCGKNPVVGVNYVAVFIGNFQGVFRRKVGVFRKTVVF